MVQARTDIIELPVCKEPAEIKEGDATADDLLTNSKKRLAEVIPDHLACLTLSIGGNGDKVTRNTILSLTVPDMEYLALHIHRVNYGDDIRLKVMCDKCGKDNGFSIPFTTLDFIPVPEDAVGVYPIFSITLPRSGYEAEFGYLTGNQELTLLQKIVNGQIDPTAMLYEHLISLNNIKKPDLKIRHLKELLGMDRAALRDAIDSKKCGYDPRVRWKCVWCNQPNITNVLTDISFLLPSV